MARRWRAFRVDSRQFVYNLESARSQTKLLSSAGKHRIGIALSELTLRHAGGGYINFGEKDRWELLTGRTMKQITSSILKTALTGG